MAKPFQLDVVSPEATVWSGQATFVVAKTPEGELGIMADHEPLMGALATGPVSVEDEAGNRTTIGVYGGFIQVLHNQVTLITDRAQIVEGGKDKAAQLADELAADADADADAADAADAAAAEELEGEQAGQ